MYCWKCGTWNAEGETRCVNCGATLPAPVAADVVATTPATPGPAAAAPSASSPPAPEAVVPPVPARELSSVLGAMPGSHEISPRPLYAGFWRRFWTAIVDYIVLFPFGLAVRILLGVGMFDSDWSRESAIVLVFGLVSTWLYDALLESSRWQGTLGQQLLGIRVTDRHGRRVSFARATARHFGQFVSLFTLGIGYLAMLFNQRRLTLHDWMSGCELVRGGLEAPVTAAVPAHAVTPLGGGAGR